jgi:hypothetical protein
MGLLNRLTNRDQMHCEPFELAAAERMEATRQHLIHTDPDAAQILATNIVTAHQSWKVNAIFSREIREYAVAKHAAGRMDLYHQLFADAQ